jgi:hypothetical protein
MEIPFLKDYTVSFLVKAPGGMVVYGLMIALVSVLTAGKAPKKKEFSCAGCSNAKTCLAANCEEGKEDA